jgi:hypothetical protein
MKEFFKKNGFFLAFLAGVLIAIVPPAIHKIDIEK